MDFSGRYLDGILILQSVKGYCVKDNVLMMRRHPLGSSGINLLPNCA